MDKHTAKAAARRVVSELRTGLDEILREGARKLLQAALENEGEIHLFGYVVFQLVGIAFQAKFFPYRYEAALAFTGLLAG